jgi:DNA helicase IV
MNIMSSTSDDSDYSCDDEIGYTITDHKETKKDTKNQEKQIKSLLELGELRTENIIEIQMIEHLIKTCDCEESRKISMGKCLELLINCSNAHLQKLRDNL